MALRNRHAEAQSVYRVVQGGQEERGGICASGRGWWSVSKEPVQQIGIDADHDCQNAISGEG